MCNWLIPSWLHRPNSYALKIIKENHMSKFFQPGAVYKHNQTKHIMDKIAQQEADANKSPEEQTEKLFFESVGEDLFLEAVAKAANQTLRTNAAAAVIVWLSEGDSSFDELDALIYGFASDHDGEELSEEELEDYNAMMEYAFEFLIANGAKADQVQSIEENADACDVVFKAVNEAIKGKDDDELVADFSVRETMMLEATKKVIRDGQVVFKKKRTKKYRQTPAQKAALKKARSKSNTAAAKANRRKSMRIRKSRGMK